MTARNANYAAITAAEVGLCAVVVICNDFVGLLPTFFMRLPESKMIGSWKAFEAIIQGGLAKISGRRLGSKL